MKAFKVIKTTDEDNHLCFEEIIFLEMVLCRKLEHQELPLKIEVGELVVTPGDVFEYDFHCIADGMFMEIHEHEWEASRQCYKFDSFV